VQLQGHPRVVAEFGSHTTLWQVLRQFDAADAAGTMQLTTKFEPQSPGGSSAGVADADKSEQKHPRVGERLFMLPACRYIRRELATLDELKATTLDDLGAVGKAMISVRHIKSTLIESAVFGDEPVAPVAESGGGAASAAPSDADLAAKSNDTKDAAAAPSPHERAQVDAARAPTPEPPTPTAYTATPNLPGTAAVQPHSAAAQQPSVASSAAPMAVDAPVVAPPRTARPVQQPPMPVAVAPIAQPTAAPAVSEAVLGRIRLEWADAQRSVDAKRQKTAERAAAKKLASEQAYIRLTLAEKARKEAAKPGPPVPRVRVPVVVPPRALVVYVRPEGPLPGWEIASEGEGFFDVTSRELRRMLGDVKRQQQPSDSPLLTKSLRSKAEKQRLAMHQAVTLRVHLSKHILQFQCHPMETAGDVLDFVKAQLAGGGVSTHLYVAPPKQILDADVTLWDARLVPRGNVRIGTTDAAEPELCAHVAAQARVLEPPKPQSEPPTQADTAEEAASAAAVVDSAAAAAATKPKPRSGYTPSGKGGGAQFLRLSKR
jgi:hypothetical protein